MVTSHTNLGQTVQETDTLQDEHKKFEAAASVSYRKILKFGTPQTIAIIVLKIEKFDVTLD